MGNKVILLSVLLFGLTLIQAGCDNQMKSQKDIYTVQADHEEDLMSLPGVVGMAIGECEEELCLKVYVEQLTSDLKSKIPDEIEGYKVDIEESGPIEAQPSSGAESSESSSSGIMQVWEKYETELMELPGVVGVAIGECEENPCLKVYVEEKTAALDEKIPDKLDGFNVDVEVSGPINIQPQP